jgi:prepilin-type N-terminal cleavage/methylation domain-containing protein
MENKAKKGFTLIELLVVIAIIALLLAIVMPSMRYAKETARRMVCGSQMRQMGTALCLYAEANNGFLPPRRNVTDINEKNRIGYLHWFRWFRVDAEYWNLGMLWVQSYLTDNGKIYFCPTPSIDDVYKYESYANPSFPTNWQPGSTAASGVRVSYFYNPESEWGKGSLSGTRFRKYEKLSKGGVNMILMADLLIPSQITHIKGWNMLYGDVSVKFSIDQEAQSEIMKLNDDTSFDTFDRVLRLLR